MAIWGLGWSAAGRYAWQVPKSPGTASGTVRLSSGWVVDVLARPKRFELLTPKFVV